MLFPELAQYAPVSLERELGQLIERKEACLVGIITGSKFTARYTSCVQDEYRIPPWIIEAGLDGMETVQFDNQARLLLYLSDSGVPNILTVLDKTGRDRPPSPVRFESTPHEKHPVTFEYEYSHRRCGIPVMNESACRALHAGVPTYL